MKATCNREGLLAALQVVSTVIPAQSPKTILRNAKLDASSDFANLIGTDLELGIRYQVSGLSIYSPGVAILPANQMIAILRELPDEQIQLEATDSGTLVSGLSSRFELNAEDPALFPEIPTIGTETVHKVRAGTIGQMIRRTSFAAAAESSRYALNAVSVVFEKKHLTMVATDGRRMALMEGPATVAGSATSNALLPPRALTLMQKVLADPEEQIEVALTDREALLRTAKVTIYSRLIEGKFPKYQDVIPRESKFAISLIVGPFYGAVRQAKIVTSKESRGVDFRFENGNLTLESRSPDHGHSEVRLPISYDKEPVNLTFDVELFADMLRVLEPEQELTLEVTDARRASMVKTNDGYTYVIMPLTRER
jgi:DNA polymerase-3 subunit beta